MRYIIAAIFWLASLSIQALTCGDQDMDGDNVPDVLDNCTFVANEDQRNTSGDGFGNICDPDFNNNGVVDAHDLSTIKTHFGLAGYPDEDLNGNGVVDAFDLSSTKAMFGGPPGPMGCVGGSITGAEIHEADGIFTFGGTTVQVDPDAYTSGDSFEWAYTSMPYLPDGFQEHAAPLSLTSSVDTPVTLSATYTGSGLVFWPTLLPGAIDQLGDPGPWVAPQPSTSHTGGVAQISAHLEAGLTKQIGPATAPYGETQDTEPVGPQTLQIHWQTENGQLPERAALVQNAISTYLQTQLDDLTCPSISGIVKLLVMPPRVFSGEPNYIARYHGGVIYFSPAAFAQDDFDLELTTVHEVAHLLQAHLMAPWFDRWAENPAILPLLSEQNVWTEAYAVAAEMRRYETSFYDGWADTYGPWPTHFRGAVHSGDKVYNYHLGLPLSYMLDRNAALTLCEFWSDPDLPLTILQEATLDVALKGHDFRRIWALFISKYNTAREEIEPGLTALLGPPATPEIAPPAENAVYGVANGMKDGETVEVLDVGAQHFSAGLEPSGRCDQYETILTVLDDRTPSRLIIIRLTTGEYKSIGSWLWVPGSLFLTVASPEGTTHMREAVVTGWLSPNIPNDPWPAQNTNDPWAETCQ